MRRLCLIGLGLSLAAAGAYVVVASARTGPTSAPIRVGEEARVATPALGDGIALHVRLRRPEPDNLVVQAELRTPAGGLMGGFGGESWVPGTWNEWECGEDAVKLRLEPTPDPMAFVCIVEARDTGQWSLWAALESLLR